MKSLWDDKAAQALAGDPLKLRVYTSRLLGQESDLVLHGGGNTSVKATVQNFFGEPESVLYVKGSGWDLATIEAPGFAPVKLGVLKQLAELDTLTDAEMVNQQRAAMLDPNAPNPSVEAILHAIIPYAYVDHTHADAVVTVTNTAMGADRVRELYGDRVLLIPYVMPGFILAKTIRDLTHGIDWSQYDGMILMNHGVFTFSDDARTAYETMIRLVSMAEDYLDQQEARHFAQVASADAPSSTDLQALAQIRRQVSHLRGQPVVAHLDHSSTALGFANLSNVADIATRGTVTPDHVIRTKPKPIVLGDTQADIEAALSSYTQTYQAYFDRNTDGALTRLDPAPRWAVWPRHGILTFDPAVKGASIIADIIEHTTQAVQMGEALGGWQPLSEDKLFEVEYWELEQAKLKKKKGSAEFQGKIALVTGAASGIGRACAELLHQQGAAVIGLDLNPDITTLFDSPSFVGIQGDVSDDAVLQQAVEAAVGQFGGLDILIGNAGVFTQGQPIEQLDAALWEKSLAINLTSQQRLLHHAIPYLKLGIDPAVVLIASRNVLAPGPGAAAYSVAKAGLTQLARVAALELASDGIRVNVLHPDCVYDTGLWTADVLEKRAQRYGITVEEYKSRNLLKQSVTSQEVAQMACAMAGRIFAKTTGAQVPIDGGNDRVI